MVDEKEYVCLYRSSIPGILVCEGCMSTVAVTVKEDCHLEGDVREAFNVSMGAPDLDAGCTNVFDVTCIDDLHISVCCISVIHHHMS